MSRKLIEVKPHFVRTHQKFEKIPFLFDNSIKLTIVENLLLSYNRVYVDVCVYPICVTTYSRYMNAH